MVDPFRVAASCAMATIFGSGASSGGQQLTKWIPALAQPTIKEQYEKQIKIIISNGKVTCRGEGDVGFFEESIRTRYKGDPIEFTIHPDFLAEVLPHLQTAVIGESKILFSGESFDHVISIER